MMFFWHFLKGLNCCVLRMKETRKGSSKDCFKSLTELRFILIVLENKIFKVWNRTVKNFFAGENDYFVA